MANKVLVIGYGNPGRLDDGIGPAVAAELEASGIPGLTVDSDYQLTVEDAAIVAEHECVVFVDAAVKGAEPFGFMPITPASTLSFSTHSVEPEAVVALARDLFGWTPRAYALPVRGYEFNAFGEGLSQKARSNATEARTFIEGVIRRDLFEDAAAAMVQESRNGVSREDKDLKTATGESK